MKLRRLEWRCCNETSFWDKVFTLGDAWRAGAQACLLAMETGCPYTSLEFLSPSPSSDTPQPLPKCYINWVLQTLTIPLNTLSLLWRLPPSLAELLRLWVLKFVMRSKSYLSNRSWQYTLCLPIVRALPECLPVPAYLGPCLSWDEVFNDVLLILKFWQHKFIWRLSFFLHTIFTWSDLPPPSHWLQGLGSRS